MGMNGISIQADKERKIKLTEQNIRDSRVNYKDVVGIAFLNRYTQFPLIVGKTISADYSTVTLPEDFEPRLGDIVHCYI